MKYLFEVKEEIKECVKCPVRKNGRFVDIYCPLAEKEVIQFSTPDWCPLQKVDDVLDELKETLEEDKPIYFLYRHCGNCEYGNRYKEHDPCNSCIKQSNWKKRIFY